jgi:hypothetical protein
MWKVRYQGTADEGLVEAQFDGTLAQLAASFQEDRIVVIQRVGKPPAAGPVDTARGSDSVSVNKS